jgi:ESS family glutamate:Na+ symporter
MKLPFPFEPLLCFGWLGIMLVAGLVLRARVKFFQNFLIPGCLIGGLLGLVLLHAGVIKIEVALLEAFGYHLFIISFISLGLTPDEDSGKAGGKSLARGALWMACVQGVTFPLQAVIGGGIVLLFALLGGELFSTFGFFIPLGLTEGPGQALSIGKVWEGYGFQHAASIGLTFGAIGYFSALLVGVPLSNWGIRRGRAAHTPKSLPLDFLRGLSQKGQQTEPAGRQTVHSSNMDTLAFHFALVGLVYILTYGIIWVIASLLGPKMGDMLWGFFFFMGLVVATLVRFVITKLGIVHLIDPGVQRRITGWSVDFLLTATIMAIQLVVVWEYVVPIAVMGILGVGVTTVVVVYLGNRLWSLNLERTIAIFGTVIGTVSTSLLLLRIIDPEFKTRVALELGLMNIFSAPIILSGMLLVSAPVLWNWSLGLTLGVFCAMLLLFLVLIKVLGMWGPNKYKA